MIRIPVFVQCQWLVFFSIVACVYVLFETLCRFSWCTTHTSLCLWWQVRVRPWCHTECLVTLIWLNLFHTTPSVQEMLLKCFRLWCHLYVSCCPWTVVDLWNYLFSSCNSDLPQNLLLLVLDYLTDVTILYVSHISLNLYNSFKLGSTKLCFPPKRCQCSYLI